MLKRIMSTFAALLLFLTPMATVHASEEAPPRATLTLTFMDEDEKPLEGVTFRMYHIGSYKSGHTGTTYSYTLSGWASGYAVDLSDIDWDDYGSITALTGTLQNYVMTDPKKPEPYKTASTGSNGNVVFEDIEGGLYLVTGDSFASRQGSTTVTCTPQPVLIPLPYPNGQVNGYGNYNIAMDLKREMSSVTDTMEITVIKKWAGPAEHPASVKVQLLKDWKVDKEVTLNESNNWTYSWKDLETDHVWRVVENNVPDGYTVVVEQDGTLFTITNTGKVTTPPAPTPQETPQPQPPAPTPEPPSETIKTGEINILPAIIGLAVVAAGAGIFIYRKKKA